MTLLIFGIKVSYSPTFTHVQYRLYKPTNNVALILLACVIQQQAGQSDFRGSPNSFDLGNTTMKNKVTRLFFESWDVLVDK